MAAQQSLETLGELQVVVSQGLQRQLQVLQEARQSHSHSDLLLPPDLAASVLSPGNLHLQSQVQSYIQRSFSSEKERDDTKAITSWSLFCVEARKLVFQALQSTDAGRRVETEELERNEAKEVFDRLDVVLSLETCGLLDANHPLVIIEEVLDRLTIETCSLYFNYIESRIHDLARGLQPGRGKGLVVLRICNELIRRLSRPTRQHTVFAGRVLSLLSSILPLGERSGVNFKGDFNVDNKTVWEEVTSKDEGSQDVDEANVIEEEKGKGKLGEDEVVQTGDKKASEENKKAEQKLLDEEAIKSIQNPRFYVLFWKVQAWFSNPTLLSSANDEQNIDLPKGVEDPVQGGTKTAMRSFRMATRHILSVFSAVERREKELVGKAGESKREREAASSNSHRTEELADAGEQLDYVTTKKRKLERQDRDEGDEDEGAFFPKYLTGRNLFEYELRDATFRLHVLAQYLILFQYLLSFSQSQKEKVKEFKNQFLASTYTNFTLDDTDDRWLRDTWKQIIYMLREVPPAGKVFANSLEQVLRREARWIKWKVDNCPTIDGSVLSQEQIAAFARSRKSLLLPMRKYPHTVGTAALSRLWEDGVKKPEPTMRTIENEEGMEIQMQTDGLDELEFTPMISSLEKYADQINRLEQEQETRRQELGWESPNVYHIAITMPQDKRQNERKRIARESKDDKLRELEEKRILHAWRASRLARSTHLDRFSKMKVEEGGTMGIRIDDITRLMKSIQDKDNKKVETTSSQGLSSTRTPYTSTESSKKEGDVEMNEADVVSSVDSNVDRLAKVEVDEGPQEEGQEVKKEVAVTSSDIKEEQVQDIDTSMQS